MDYLFKREGLNFRFTIYDLLAMTTNDGIMGFVAGSTTVQKAVVVTKKESNSIKAFSITEILTP